MVLTTVSITVCVQSLGFLAVMTCSVGCLGEDKEFGVESG